MNIHIKLINIDEQQTLNFAAHESLWGQNLLTLGKQNKSKTKKRWAKNVYARQREFQLFLRIITA